MRELNDKSIKTFYHYCSTATFHSIVTGRTIRLSDPSAMNDKMEGLWCRKLFINMCQEIGLSEEETALINLIFDIKKISRRAIICFSEEGDLLSQWRGYADDGRGFAIGFSRDIASLPADEPPAYFNAVWYDESTQRSALMPYAEMAANALKQKADSAYLRGIIEDVQLYAYKIKNPGFGEEREWRLIVELDEKFSGYNIRQDCLVPYKEYHLRPKHAQHFPEFIKEIVIGPKNKTPTSIVKEIIPPELSNYNNVIIRESDITYR